MAMVKYSRFDVLLVDLNLIKGSEIQKTRPCVIISPDEMNHHINTLIIAPMTSTIKGYITRIPVKFDTKDGEIVLDQIRAIDKSQIVKKLGKIDSKTALKVIKILIQMFKE